jgi:uncharacterized protein (TIGR00251 family)
MKLDVKVVSGASRNAVKSENGRLKIYVTAPPEKGRANVAVIEVLAKHLGIKKQNVVLVKGKAGPQKTFEILI